MILSSVCLPVSVTMSTVHSGSMLELKSCTVLFLGRDFLFTSHIVAVRCIVQPQRTKKLTSTKDRL